MWSFQTAQEEARAIAQSCDELIRQGMAGREDEIVILIANRRVQLDLIALELGNLGLPYDPPRGASLTDEHESMRGRVRIAENSQSQESNEEDYPAHREVLGVLSGVGHTTAKAVADACIANNHNFHGLFYLPACPPWLSGRAASATQRVMSIAQTVGNWSMADTLASRVNDITTLLSSQIFNSGRNAANHLSIWSALSSALPILMTLDELFQFLAADTESDQQAVLDLVNQRIGTSQLQGTTTLPKRIRILTMHGAKGLSGKAVFIPSAEQGIIPNFKALQATGLLIEQRRLFYVSLTRTMACCIVSHAAQHTGAQAMALSQTFVSRLTRSQFLNEMNIASVTRTSGLSVAEASAIVTEIGNL